MKKVLTFLSIAALPWLGFAANVTGTWKSEFNSQIGLQSSTYTLKQDDTNLTGRANAEVNDARLRALEERALSILTTHFETRCKVKVPKNQLHASQFT